MKEIHVAIVEDTTDIREGLSLLIGSSEGFICEHVFANAEDALTGLPQIKPDVVLTDINLPGISGIELVKILKPMIPETQFLMCSVYEDDESIFQSLKNGATGYLIKNSTPIKILSAIQEISEGGSPMSSSIARRVIASFRSTGPVADYDLSEREKEILHYLSEGHMYKEVAAQLFISIDTVRTHVRKIYEKLEVHSRTEALNKYFAKRN
jgi:DNA-binding NarL/FixJ family response regulator